MQYKNVGGMRGGKTILALAAALAGVQLLTPGVAVAADFWWRGDRSGVWSDTLTITSIVFDTNFATDSSGLIDRFALPGSGDVVRFASSNASNLNTILGGSFSIQGLTTETSLTGDVGVLGGLLQIGGGGIVTNAPRKLTIGSELIAFQPTLQINTAHASSVVSVLSSNSSSFGISKTGPGLLELNTFNSYTGGTRVVNGTLSTQATSALPSNRDLTIGDSVNGSQARLNTNGFLQTLSSLSVYATNLPDTTVVDVGTGGLTLGGNFSLLNTVNNTGNLWGAVIAGGSGSTLDLNGGTRTFTLAGQRVGQQELTVRAAITNGGIILNANPSTLDGTPAGMLLDASAPNTYTGGTTVNAGVLKVNNTNTTLGTGPLVINTTGSVASQVILNNPFQTVTTLRTDNTGSVAPRLTLNGTFLTVDQSVDSTFLGIIEGDGVLVKKGSGNLSLQGQRSTYTGGTEVIEGTLTTNETLPVNTAVTIGDPVNGGAPLLNVFGLDNFISSLTIYAPAQNTTSINIFNGTLTLNGNVQIFDTQNQTGNLFRSKIEAGSAGILDLGGGVRTFTIAGQNVAQQELTIEGSIQNGGIVLVANPSVTVGNAAGMVLDAAQPNFYAGGTTVNAGTLTVNSTTTLGPGALMMNTAGGVASRVHLNNAAQTITSLSTGTVEIVLPVLQLNGTALTLAQSSNTTFAGVIEGTGSLTKTGTGGILILTGTNTYTGDTTVSNGDLNIGNGGTTGSVAGDIVVNAPGQLFFNRSNDFTYAGDLTGDGFVLITLPPTATQTFTGNVYTNAQFSFIGGGTVVFEAPVTLSIDSIGGTAIFGAGTSCVLAAGGDNMLVTSRIFFETPTNTLETNDNDLIVNYNPNFASPLASLLGYQLDGRLVASTDVGGISTLMVLFEAADFGLTEFNGVEVDESTVIGKFTYTGDANLDGQVDAFDYSVIDDNFGQAGTFITGDLNQDGFVDAFDYSSIDDTFGAGVGNPLKPAASTEVFIPEPSSMGMLAVCAMMLNRRRRV